MPDSSIHTRRAKLTTAEAMALSRDNPSYFKRSRQHIRLVAFRPARTPPRDILGVLGRDDVLAGVCVIQHGIAMREEAVEEPVEDGGGDEGVDVADGEARSGQLPTHTRRQLPSARVKRGRLTDAGRPAIH